MRRDPHRQLPEWFQRPRPTMSLQTSLFPPRLEEELVAVHVSADDVERWRSKGWLSFGLDVGDDFRESHIHELVFVRDVVRSGLSDAAIAALFAQLERPMNFNPHEVAYSFALGWVTPTYLFEPDANALVEEHVEGWINALADDGDLERLEKIQQQVARRIEDVLIDRAEETT